MMIIRRPSKLCFSAVLSVESRVSQPYLLTLRGWLSSARRFG